MRQPAHASPSRGQHLESQRMTASLSGRDLGHSFADLSALEDFDIEVAGGETVAVVGPSGCGKSTLLELICGLREPDRGSISVGGESAAEARLARCAYMPQTDCLLPWYSALDNASLALRNNGASRADARRQAAGLFSRFGLEGFEDSSPDELSGGMRQRVAFLRTLLSEKGVLLLDEPFAALDAITRAELQEWLRPTLADGNRTTVLVTHDVEEALYMADSVLVVSSRPGRVLERIESPRDPAAPRSEQVTSPGFTALRERILERLISPSNTAGKPGP